MNSSWKGGRLRRVHACLPHPDTIYFVSSGCPGICPARTSQEHAKQFACTLLGIKWQHVCLSQISHIGVLPKFQFCQVLIKSDHLLSQLCKAKGREESVEAHGWHWSQTTRQAPVKANGLKSKLRRTVFDFFSKRPAMTPDLFVVSTGSNDMSNEK